MSFSVNNFNPVVVSNQPGSASTSLTPGSNSVANLLQDIVSLLEQVQSDPQQRSGMPSSPTAGAPSSPISGMPSSIGGIPLQSSSATPTAPSSSVAAPQSATAASSAGTDLSSVNLQMPGSRGVPLLQGPKNSDGSTDLYSNDADGKGVQHRGVMNADGSITFDNADAASKVLDFNGKADVAISPNSDGTLTIGAAQS